jgi:hypothetical protein
LYVDGVALLQSQNLPDLVKQIFVGDQHLFVFDLAVNEEELFVSKIREGRGHKIG